MTRYILSFALLAALSGSALAAAPSGLETNSGTASYMQLQLRDCGRLDNGEARDACKAHVWHSRNVAFARPERHTELPR